MAGSTTTAESYSEDPSRHEVFVMGYDPDEPEEVNALEFRQVRAACYRLFANTQVESYMHMDLGAESELDSIKKLSKEYAEAKELAFAEASQPIDVVDAEHVLQNDKLLGNRVDEVVKEWDAQKEVFYERTGLSRGNELAVIGNDESGALHHEDDGFDQITQLLLE
ncbi:uncharacterized protein LOC133904611 [Phragmites australis]|uniref:uncharacterized protein LOC133904611 n=1 Tax=Phragmites australis TaxID=29695 RepID=UPI002D773CC3|nr:uncharacterized protein LOC133904611 [Phragmites australis]